jgi:hypothetical protein
VKLPTDNITLCRDLCDARKDCTGFEYYSNWTRCEIWKVPIGAAEDVEQAFECHKYIGPQKTENKPVWVSFKVMFTGLNFSGILADESGKVAVHAAVVSSQKALLSLLTNQSDGTGVQAANLTLSQVQLALGEATSSSISVITTILPKEDVNPLAVYALLRGDNPDGIPNVRASIILEMEKIWGGLSPDSSTVTCDISERDLAFSGLVPENDQDDAGDKDDEESKDGGENANDKNTANKTSHENETDDDGDDDSSIATGGALQGAMPAAMLVFLAMSLAAVVSAA